LNDMYDELYEAWKKEKENMELQPLPKDFYSKLADYVKSLREERRMLDRKTLKARLMHHEFENVKKRVLLRFLQEIPAIIGSDMRTYGPFKAEDIATLPIENARVLVEKGIAVEVEAKA